MTSTPRGPAGALAAAAAPPPAPPPRGAPAPPPRPPARRRGRRPARRRRIRCVDVGENVNDRCPATTDGAGREVAQFDAPRLGAACVRAAAARLRARRGRAFAACRLARHPAPARAATPAAAPAPAAAGRIRLVGNPLRVGRERAAGRVRHRDVLVGLEVQKVQHRLGLGRRGIGERQACTPPTCRRRTSPGR